MAIARVDKPIFTSPSGEETQQPQQGTFDRLSWWMRILSHIGRPHVMSEETATKAPGIFLPSWWLGLLLLPAAYGIWSAGMSLSRIETKIDSAEYRIKAVETQGRLNDEHTRQLELTIAETKSMVETLARVRGDKKEN